MPLIEKLSNQDLYLLEIFRNPALLGEFIANFDKTEREDVWEYSIYQREVLCDFAEYSELCCGRAVGKTVSLSDLMVWILINKIFPNDYIIYTVPNKAHLEPVFTNLTRLFRSNTLLRNFIDPKKGINSSDHTIKLLNHTDLICRIAGTTGTGANVVGLHSPFEILDEAGLYPWGTWIEFQPTLNTWEKGFRRIVSGVPTGLRDKNVLYYVDQQDTNYKKHRVSAHENPRYTEKDEKENLEKYGGADSDDYIHLVLGEHGVPVFAVFDRNLMQIDVYPVFKVMIDGIAITNSEQIYTKLSGIPAISEKYDYTLVGIDLGYTEPTAIHILYSKNGLLKYHARIQLSKVTYPLQKKLFDFIDDKFGKFDIIGVDFGGPGKPVVQDWLESDEFLHKDYKKRMIPVDYSGWIVLGTNSDGEEIKTKMKPFAVSLAQEYTNSHKLIYSSTDYDFISELERVTYTKTPSGEIVYRTLTPRGGERGEDHHTSALLSAMVAHYIVKDATQNKPKSKRLYTPTWLFRREILNGGMR
jgi:hypothetical protein